jgi:fucose 4-O-acetylase-like acetyltransferase
LALAPQPERQAWVDTARGIGIILVVYGHALRGHVTSGAFDPVWHADVQDDVIYAFHMPLFFFLAGLFAQRSLAKGAGHFLRDKALTLVYPYFLWSVVSIALGLAAANMVNTAIDAAAIADLWRTPVYQYWFLYALLICQIIMLVTLADWRITALLCLLSAIFGGVSGLGIVTVAFAFYYCFGLGILVAPRATQLQATPAVLGGWALALLSLLVATYFVDEALPIRLIIVARAVFGSAAVIALAMLVAPYARWLTVLGMASMSIYVLHTIFSAGLRMALHATGFENNLVALMLGTLIGLGAPLMIWWVARRYEALPWFGLGAQLRVRQGAAV